MTRRTLAAAVAGLVSLSLAGIALANEPDDPTLVPPSEEPCEEVEVDEGTDGAMDGSGEEGAVADEATCDDGTETGGTDGGTDGLPEATDGEVEEQLEPEAPPVEDLEVDEGERPQNHGWYVSEATKTCPEAGRARGECISAVAQSDLGKDHRGEGQGEGKGEDEGPGERAGAGDRPGGKPAEAGERGNGGGKGRGPKG